MSLRFARPIALCLSGGLLLSSACASTSSPPQGGGDESSSTTTGQDPGSTSSPSSEGTQTDDTQSESTSEDDAPGSSSTSDDQSSSVHPGELPKDEVPADFEQLRSSKARDESPDIEIEDLRIVRAGNNNLGFEVQRRLAFEDDKNGAISPISLQLAMGLVHAAARGETQSEMQKAFGFHPDPQKTHAALNRMSLQLASLEEEKSEISDPVFVRIANRTFVRPGLDVGKTYLDTLATQYGAGVYVSDFAKDPEDVANKINGWVAKITRDKIPSLFPAGALTANTVWAFVNAIYFKAPWKIQFAKEATKDAEFTKLGGEKTTVKMMQSWQEDAKYGQDDQSTWVELSLGRQGALAAIFVLPKQGEFAKVEKAMNNDRFDSMLSASKTATVNIKLPKFKLKTGSMTMNDVFTAMGANKLFGEADLSGVSDDGKTSLPGLKVLYHSVFVAMDENGVEAAAATGGAGDDSEPEEIKEVVLDRPFLFMVYDHRSGLVLFNGRVVDPQWN